MTPLDLDLPQARDAAQQDSHMKRQNQQVLHDLQVQLIRTIRSPGTQMVDHLQVLPTLRRLHAPVVPQHQALPDPVLFSTQDRHSDQQLLRHSVHSGLALRLEDILAVARHLLLPNRHIVSFPVVRRVGSSQQLPQVGIPRTNLRNHLHKADYSPRRPLLTRPRRHMEDSNHWDRLDHQLDILIRATNQMNLIGSNPNRARLPG